MYRALCSTWTDAAPSALQEFADQAHAASLSFRNFTKGRFWMDGKIIRE